MYSLNWRAPGSDFTAVPGPGVERVIDQMQLDDAGEWLGFEGTASTLEATTPCVEVRITIPAPGLSALSGLNVANKLNRHGFALVHFDEETGALVVRHGLIYTGYHEGPPLEPGIERARDEATVNMVIAAISKAEACVDALRSADTDRKQPSRRLY